MEQREKRLYTVGKSTCNTGGLLLLIATAKFLLVLTNF